MYHVAIISGGISGEREVSIASARNIQNQLTSFSPSIFIFPEERNRFLEERANIDCVIPMIHGAGGEDGVLQGFLQTMEIPYLFSDIKTHAIALDKQLTKMFVQTFGIAVPDSYTKTTIQKASFPCIVKPRAGGSSVEVSVIHSAEELKGKNLEEEFFVCERFIKGREFTVGVVQTQKGVEALPVIEIKTTNEIFGYKQKYEQEHLAEEVCPAQIDEKLSKQLQQAAVLVHEQLGAKHISRSDFIVDSQNQLFFLEINTIPGMTKTSLVPKSLKTAGYDLVELFNYWIQGVLKQS